MEEAVRAALQGGGATILGVREELKVQTKPVGLNTVTLLKVRKKMAEIKNLKNNL